MLSRISISLRFRVDGRKRFENARYGYVFFLKKRGKGLRFQKYRVRVDDSSKRSSLRKQPTFCVAKLNVGSFLKRRKKRRQWFTTLLPACSNIIIVEFIYDKKI